MDVAIAVVLSELNDILAKEQRTALKGFLYFRLALSRVKLCCAL